MHTSAHSPDPNTFMHAPGAMSAASGCATTTWTSGQSTEIEVWSMSMNSNNDNHPRSRLFHVFVQPIWHACLYPHHNADSGHALCTRSHVHAHVLCTCTSTNMSMHMSTYAHVYVYPYVWIYVRPIRDLPSTTHHSITSHIPCASMSIPPTSACPSDIRCVPDLTYMHMSYVHV